MNPADEKQFRFLLAVCWALFYVVRIFFVLKQRGVRNSLTRHETQEMFFAYAFAVAGFVVVVYAFSPWLDFAHIPLPIWARYGLGCPMLIGYLTLFSWTHHTLGRNWSGLLDIHEDHVLVTNGPYRFVRHPMYSSWFLAGIGYFLLSANWFIAALYLSTLTLMYLSRVGAEERMMIEEFGDSYRQYMHRCGRLLPQLRRETRSS